MSEPLIPGEIRPADGEHYLNKGRQTKKIVVTNDGDRAIQVGAHYHLPDTNSALNFDRESTQGYRLDVPAGKSIRFEPGASKTVPLVELGGKKIVPGLQLKNSPK